MAIILIIKILLYENYQGRLYLIHKIVTMKKKTF